MMKLETISPTNDGSTMTRPSLLIKHVDTTSLIERREEKAVFYFDTLIFCVFWDKLGCFSLGCRIEEALEAQVHLFFSFLFPQFLQVLICIWTADRNKQSIEVPFDYSMTINKHNPIYCIAIRTASAVAGINTVQQRSGRSKTMR